MINSIDGILNRSSYRASACLLVSDFFAVSSVFSLFVCVTHSLMSFHVIVLSSSVAPPGLAARIQISCFVRSSSFGQHFILFSDLSNVIWRVVILVSNVEVCPGFDAPKTKSLSVFQPQELCELPQTSSPLR